VVCGPVAVPLAQRGQPRFVVRRAVAAVDHRRVEAETLAGDVLERRADLAIILGAYGRERGGPDSGKFTLTLRLGADGQWRILSDMDNGNSR